MALRQQVIAKYKKEKLCIIAPSTKESEWPFVTPVRPGLKLTQVVFTRHFSKLTRVEPGLVVFIRQTNPGRTRVSSVYTTETNPGQ